MLELYTKLQARLAQEDGQTMAEYAVVLAVIAIGIFHCPRRPEWRDQRRARQGHSQTSRTLHFRSLLGTIDRTGRGAIARRPVSFSGRRRLREQAAQRLVARAALDERADLRRARGDQRDVALADGRLLGQQAGAQERLADLERERALVARRSRARGGGTPCGSRRTCPSRRGGAACAARHGGAAAGRPRCRSRRRPRRRAVRLRAARPRPRPRARARRRRAARRAGRPSRRATASAPRPAGSVSSRSPAGSSTASMRTRSSSCA